MLCEIATYFRLPLDFREEKERNPSLSKLFSNKQHLPSPQKLKLGARTTL